jgi:hypothetical protein
MNTEQEETTQEHIANSNIVNIDTSSSTDTSTSSFGTLEVSATGRPPYIEDANPDNRKHKLQNYKQSFNNVKKSSNSYNNRS